MFSSRRSKRKIEQILRVQICSALSQLLEYRSGRMLDYIYRKQQWMGRLEKKLSHRFQF